MLLAVILAGTLMALAGVHLYWAFGGRWPGHDEASLVEHVVGRTAGMRAPGPLACVAVAAALAAGSLLALGAVAPPSPLSTWLWFARWPLVVVFGLRGLATYVPAVFRYAEGTPFARLNRRAYGPLCLAIALGLLTLQL
ncbi:DUF3995 domain-containing protein [Caulobacter henricii]|uniref:DUF3995 domain-containing protein n=1 Tax=Caulobacter henricii TaxID=69395 RepID=A0A0P0NVY1_9CAUL|nr:DUF3995 domain-containing protein [Caulobacter henricii]ALL12173.1 hypothetical protein AQ619_01670 [Caulobacter henricii]